MKNILPICAVYWKENKNRKTSYLSVAGSTFAIAMLEYVSFYFILYMYFVSMFVGCYMQAYSIHLGNSV